MLVTKAEGEGDALSQGPGIVRFLLARAFIDNIGGQIQVLKFFRGHVREKRRL